MGEVSKAHWFDAPGAGMELKWREPVTPLQNVELVCCGRSAQILRTISMTQEIGTIKFTLT